METETVRSDFDPTEKDPSFAVIEAIAAIEGIPPTTLTRRLHDHIDPEALNELMTSANEASVSFSADQYQVQVTEDTIVVTY